MQNAGSSGPYVPVKKLEAILRVRSRGRLESVLGSGPDREF